MNVVNCNLPPTVRILECKEVSGSFSFKIFSFLQENIDIILKRENEMTANDNGFISKNKKNSLQ